MTDFMEWANLVGPAFSPSQTAEFLGVDHFEELPENLLRLDQPTAGPCYPVFQFQSPKITLGVRSIVGILKDAVATPWTIASWLQSPHQQLGGLSPATAIGQDRLTDVEALAHRWASDLALQ